MLLTSAFLPFPRACGLRMLFSLIVRAENGGAKFQQEEDRHDGIQVSMQSSGVLGQSPVGVHIFTSINSLPSAWPGPLESREQMLELSFHAELGKCRK